VRILIAHNRYQHPGGEDVGVQDEYGNLLNHGHQVQLLEANNDHIHGVVAQSLTALNAIYSPSSKRKVASAIADFKPDLVHVHNYFPVFSPSIYYACQEASVPVVQTLHNYRLICPSGILFRNNQVCEDCLGKTLAWPGVIHGCYHDSRLGTAAVAAMLLVHRTLRTYDRCVQVLIALTEFARRKLLEGGFSSQKLVVKSSFVDIDPGIGQGNGGYFLFLGRLSAEKGIRVLLKAWETLGQRARLKIAGDGPLAGYVRERQAIDSSIEYLGFQSRPEVNRLMQGASALVFPSLWYEGIPRTILESFATGTPVISSNLGSMETVVQHQRTGLHFVPNDSEDLVRQINWALSHQSEWSTIRHLARTEYETKYSAESNYQLLIRIYEDVLENRYSRSVSN